MDYIGIIGAVVGVLTLGGGVITFFVTWGKINQRVDDQAADIEALGRRIEGQADDIERAQDAAFKVGGLATAVEHMGQRFADQIKHLVDVMSLQNEHVRTELTDIKDQLKTVRTAPRERRAN
jgi:archaellum component FlaC